MMGRMLMVGAVWMSAALNTPAQQRTDPPAMAGVRALRDVAYVTDGHERNRLDLFLPEQAEQPLPLIIWIHGGGWQNGSKEGCPPLRKGYLQRGYAVASKIGRAS